MFRIYLIILQSKENGLAWDSNTKCYKMNTNNANIATVKLISKNNLRIRWTRYGINIQIH